MLLRHFWQDRNGATAAIMSLALVPIIATLALATDYSKAVQHKALLQQAVDSAATALARDTDALLLSNEQLQARAQSYAKSVTAGDPVNDLKIAAKVDSDRVEIEASGTVKLAFANVFGTDSLVVEASVTVERAKAKTLELALALDNTGSMAQSGKLTQLKAAVKSLVDYMSDAAKNPGVTKMSMVPFTTVVKTDPAWMPNSYLQLSAPNNWDGCVTDRDQPNDVTDLSPAAGSTESLFVWGTTTTSKKHGVTTTTTTPVSCGNLAGIIPLTTDLAKIKTAADSMIASGNTNVPIGVAWAWHSLSSSAPLNQGAAYGTKNVQKVMIVLTDGDNTANRWGGNSNGEIDARLAKVCDNVKASGIVIYTIRVIDGNANALSSCASSPTHYFSVTNSSQLVPVFQQIATALTQMRISK